MNRSALARSKLKRHGLRSPYTQISPRAPGVLTNGFDGGITYGDAESTSIRMIFPSSVSSRSPLFIGSPPDPPSPSDT